MKKNDANGALGVMPVLRARTSVRRLAIAVLFVAFGIASLRSSSFMWLRTINTMVVLTLLISILAATYYRGPNRAFAVGFALFSWTYYFLAFGPGPSSEWHLFDPEGGRGFAEWDQVRPNLLSSEIVARTSQLVTRFPMPGVGFESYEEVYARSTWIGHLLFTLLVGYFGGHLSRYMASRSDGGQAEKVTSLIVETS